MTDFALGNINTASMVGNTSGNQALAKSTQLQRQLTATQTVEGATPLTGDALVKKHKELKQAAQQLEGVFLNQLLTAMDKTVDRKDSFLSGGPGEDMFREMMYQHISEDIATHPHGSGLGLAESIYRQMSDKLPPLPAQAKQAYANQNQPAIAPPKTTMPTYNTTSGS